MFVATECAAEMAGIGPEEFARHVGLRWTSYPVHIDTTHSLHLISQRYSLWTNLVPKNVSVLVVNTGAWWNYAKLG